MTRPSPRLLAVTLATAIFAFLALASGLDRYSEYQPATIRLVPSFAAADAGRSRAATALALGDYAAAAEAAEESILRDPLDPRGPAVLGAARQMSGDVRAAEAAFRIAAAMSWREPLTQVYWFTRSVEDGDVDLAAIRLDALLRTVPGFAPAQLYLSALEESAAGRTALAARIAQDPAWAEAYLTASGASDAVLRSRARFLAGPVGTTMALGCDGPLPMVRELLKRNFRGEAQLLLAAHCSDIVPEAGIADPGFERIARDDVFPFGWRRHGSGDIRIGFSGDDNRAIEMESRAGVTRLVLSQPIALAPGHYHVMAATKDGARRLIVSIDCGVASRPRRIEGDIAADGQAVTVPNCADPLLGLWLRPGEGAVRIDDLRIKPR